MKRTLPLTCLLLLYTPLLAKTTIPFYLYQKQVTLPQKPLTVQLYNNSSQPLTIQLNLFRIHNPKLLLKENIAFQKPKIENTLLRQYLNAALQKKYPKTKIYGKITPSTHVELTLSKTIQLPPKSSYQPISLGKQPSGLYLLSARWKNYITYCLASVSKLTFLLRRSEKQTLVYAVERTNGKPIPNATVQLFQQNQLLAKGKTSTQGIFQAHHPYFPKIHAIVQYQNHIALGTFAFYPSLVDTLKGLILTDRPVYQPGEKVFFKAIFRKLSHNQYLPLPPQTITYQVINPLKKTILSHTCNIKNGFAYANFTLPTQTKLGNYQILVKIGHKQFATPFLVRHYQKPKIYVHVYPSTNATVCGTNITFQIHGKYYAGGNLANAQVIYTLSRKTFYQPLFQQSQHFYSQTEFQSFLPEKIFTKVAKLNNQGKLHIQYTTPLAKKDYFYTLSVRVLDASREQATNSATIYVAKSSIQLGIKTHKSLYKIEEDAKITLKAIDIFQKPAPNLPISLEFYQQTNSPSNWKLFLQKSLTTNSNGKAYLQIPLNKTGKILIVAKTKDPNGRPSQASLTVWVEQGSLPLYYSGNVVEIIPDKSNYHIGETARILLLYPKPQLHPLTTWESGQPLGYTVQNLPSNTQILELKITPNMSPNFYLTTSAVFQNSLLESTKNIVVLPTHKQLKINVKLDKTHYQPGQTAKLQVEVRDSNNQPVQTDLSLSVVDNAIYAISQEQTPPLLKFFYSLRRPNSSNNHAISLESYGYAKLSKRLPDPIRIQIQQLNRLLLQMQKLQGKKREKTFQNLIKLFSKFYPILQQVFQPFYKEDLRRLGTNLQKSLSRLERERLKQLLLQFAKKTEKKSITRGARRRALGAPRPRARTPRLSRREDSDSASLERRSLHAAKAKNHRTHQSPPPLQRHIFRSTAFWKANIFTNSQGIATIHWRFPHNITQWRLTLHTIDPQTRVATKRLYTRTKLSLFLQANLPPFLRKGDRCQLYFNVRNLQNQPQNAQFLLTLQSPSNQQKFSQNLSLQPGQTKTISLPFLAKETGTLQLQAKILGQNGSDSLKKQLPILPFGIKVSERLQGFLPHKKPLQLTLKLPQNTQSPKIIVRLNQTYLQAVLQALPYLTSYPYGCTEQTMSRFIPDLAASDALQTLQLNRPNYQKKLNKFVHAGLQRIYSLQHPDGGWGWWQNDQSHPFLTAYVLWGLSRAKKLGYPVQTTVLQKAKNFAQTKAQNPKTNYSQRAFLLYALSVLYPQISQKLIGKIFDNLQRQTSSPTTKALLLLTYNNMKQTHSPETKTLYQELLKHKKTHPQGVYWGNTNGLAWNHHAIEVSALVLRALIAYNPKEPTILQGMQWLLQQRKNAIWLSTRATAFVVETFLAFAKQTQEQHHNQTLVQLQLNHSKPIQTKLKLNGSTLQLPHTHQTTNQLTLSTNSKGVHYEVYLQYLLTQKYIPPKQAGFKIKRLYFVQSPSQPRRPLQGPVSPKDTIIVQLKIQTKQQREFVLLQDPLPPTARPIHNNSPTWKPPYTHKEFRQNHAAFFFSQLPAGETTVEYSFHPSIAGEFYTPPAKVELMYFPYIAGNSQSHTIHVK